VQIDTDVMDVLTAAETDGNGLRLTGQLDPKLYKRVNKALEAAGGKWHRGKQAHLFTDDAAGILAALTGTGTVLTDSDAQFFPTPAAVCDRLFELAELGDGDLTALEPSAGRGAIASRLWPHVDTVDCIELHQKYAADIEAGDYARNLWTGDFLAFAPHPEYDRVVMNPPFTRGQDIDHVRHALRFLVPGGLLVSVMMSSILTREDRKHSEFREMVAAAGGHFEKLPGRAFRESGTDISTVIVVIRSSPTATSTK
jgi:hypothetical protein